MSWLFDQIASCWGSWPLPDQARFHGLRSYAVDGVVWSLPDTAANLQQFSRPNNAHGSRAWPHLRAACLMDTYTHLIRAACFGDFSTGELSFAAPLIHAVPGESLTICDRG